MRDSTNRDPPMRDPEPAAKRRSPHGGGERAGVGRVTVRRVETHADGRGVVFEPIGAEALGGQRNAHVVLTEPGRIRGNHVHRVSTEILVVRGPARVRYRDREGVADVDVGEDEVLAFTVPPNVPHAVLATGPGPSLVVAFRDREHDPEDPDVERVELLGAG